MSEGSLETSADDPRVEAEESPRVGDPSPPSSPNVDESDNASGDEALYDVSIDSGEDKSGSGNEDVDQGRDEAPSVENDGRPTVDAAEECGDDDIRTKEDDMAEESQRSSAAEIAVTSNGDLDQNPDEVFCGESFPGKPAFPDVPESCVPSSNYASTTEGVIESGPHKGSSSLPSSPVAPFSPSLAVASRLARSSSESQADTDGTKTEPPSGALVLSDDMKTPAMEKLDLVRKWSINTYKCTRQILSEKLGRGSKTVDLDLEAQIDVLRENKRKYQQVIKLAQTLATQLAQVMQTQRQLGDAFADLSLKTPELHEEFGYNADTQKLLSKNGETLLAAINFFINSVNTLVDKTIEDTMINIKQYEIARVEYDAYRTDLEELNLGPRDNNTLPKIEHSQQLFQAHRDKYERMRNDVSVKLKFLEENKVKVLHNQLILFHNAIAAYYSGNQQQLEQTMKQFHIKLKAPGSERPSWLEEN
ncbi:arfaptin-1 isoform X1 [Syngnathus scovelli]|uniref:arfaptin-1 isoform X1 n=2 Tax=Syngnathus scovelli TaxID=161590 RepID=UPI002110E625|nr:arfaptin-1 isoform X1 [Syngnathus scovelli]XP_049576431.1 arfaptin-1 isoform X1 [Syngnathus scovelli]